MIDKTKILKVDYAVELPVSKLLHRVQKKIP
jgi:hypothetical protein